MSYHYLHVSDSINPHKLPNITVDYFEWGEVPIEDWDDAPSQPGYYWAYGFPGCIPDSPYIGPFTTEEEAVADARDF